jgi:hypothetical protein
MHQKHPKTSLCLQKINARNENQGNPKISVQHQKKRTATKGRKQKAPVLRLVVLVRVPIAVIDDHCVRLGAGAITLRNAVVALEIGKAGERGKAR